MTAGCAYYTDSRLDPVIAQACRNQLQRAAQGLPIASVSLAATVGNGSPDVRIDWQMPVWSEPGVVSNVGLPIARGYLAMFTQILAGLEALDTDVAFLVEHDVLYHPSAFAFTPPRKDVYYYNQNVFKLRASDGHVLHYPCSQTSGLCADRQLLVEHYRKRVAIVQERGFTRAMGFEPGTHNRPERVDDFGSATWMSEYPNVDIRHDTNLTESRWRKEQFRNQQYTAGWTESDRVPGWGVTAGRFHAFLAELQREVHA